MQWLAIAALFTAGAGWGLGLPLGKIALHEMPAAHLVLLRFAIAAIAAAPFVLARRDTRAVFRSPAVLAAGALYGVAFMMQFEGLASVSVTLAALLVGVMPALVAVYARLVGERMTKLSWVGVVAATAGAAVIAGKPSGAGSPFGIALSLLSLVVFLGWMVSLKKAPAAASAMAVPAATIVVAALTILPIALVMHGPPRLDVSAAAWAGVAGQGLLSTLLATSAWQYGSTRVGSATAGVFINVEPLLGAALGVLLFGDTLTAGLIVGGALILLGSLAVVEGERKAALAIAHDAPATPG